MSISLRIASKFRKNCLLILTLTSFLPGFAETAPNDINQINPCPTEYRNHFSYLELWEELGFNRLETDEFIDLLSQLVDLEELDLKYIYLDNLNQFIENPPSLPKLKSLKIDESMSQDLSWILSYPALENLSITGFTSLDLAPLSQLKHLSKLELVTWESDATVVHGDQLPTSLKTLILFHCKIDPHELNHLRLKELQLSSEFIAQLPQKESLTDLVSLNITSSSIRDLNPIQDNHSLKIFEYSFPNEEGSEANFEVLATLPNLEELTLIEFPQSQSKFQAATQGLSKLQKLMLTGNELNDLSFLNANNLQFLATSGKLLPTLPTTVLSSPSLVKIFTFLLAREDSNFICDHISPNLRELDLAVSEYCDLAKLSRFPLEILLCADVVSIENKMHLLALAPTLQKLSVRENVLHSMIETHGEDALEAFVKLNSLQIYLDDSGNNSSLDYLARFPSLKELEIGKAERLTSSDLDIFYEMKNLKSLEIWDAPEELDEKIQELERFINLF